MRSCPVARIVLFASIVAASGRTFAAKGGPTADGLLARLAKDLGALGYQDQARSLEQALAPLPASGAGRLVYVEGDTSERTLLVSRAREWGPGHLEARFVWAQGVWGFGGHYGWKDTRPSTFQIMTTLDLAHDPTSSLWTVGILTRDSYTASTRQLKLAAGPEGLRLDDRTQRDAHHIGHSDTERGRATTVLRRTVHADDGSVTIAGVRRQSGHREVTDHVKGRVTLRERRPGKVERLQPTRLR
jgi:hypothetical protein